MSPFAVETIIRKRWTTVDDGHGNQVSAGDPDLLAIPGCSLDPGQSAEDNAGRDTINILWTVYAPIDADVTAYDKVSYQSVDYDVIGAPQRFTDPLGFNAHCVINLREVVG